jgi:O-Antigen ligase
MHLQVFLSRQNNTLLLFSLLGIAIGVFTPIAVEQAMNGNNLLLGLTPFALPVFLLMATRPVFGAIAIIGFAFVSPSFLPPLIEFGELSLRYVDGMFALLICIVLARIAVRQRISISTEFRELFGPLLLFILYIGISLVVVRVRNPELFAASLASYLRLIITVSFAPVLHFVLRDRWDMYIFHKGLIIFSMTSVAVGQWLVGAGLEGGEAKAFGDRSGGLLGTSSFGLVSGLLVLYAFIRRDEKPRSLEWAIALVLGLLGLSLDKSAISIFAVAGAFTVYIAAMRSHRGGASGLVRVAVVGTILAAAAVLAVLTFRPNDMSKLADLSGGSFAVRLMLGYAGVLIFLDNPLIGVGWQASSAEGVIASPVLMATLGETFSQLTTTIFSVIGRISVHNMYVQFLAELGIIGFALFAWVFFRTAKRVGRIVRNVPAESPYKTRVQFYAVALIFLFLWWNGNPLYGGQTESILAVTFLALLANVAQLEKQRVGTNSSW